MSGQERKIRWTERKVGGEEVKRVKKKSGWEGLQKEELKYTMMERSETASGIVKEVEGTLVQG